MRLVGWAAASLCALVACGDGAKGRDAAAGSGGNGGDSAGGTGGAPGGAGGAGGVGGVTGRGGGGGVGGVAGVGGATGGGSGRGGTSGGNGGVGGSAGATSGAGGDGSGLPACEISARPADPTNAGADGGRITSASGTCNSIVLSGAWVSRGCFDRQGDGGVLDGGLFDGPAGGVIRDGDYDVISADGSLTTGTCAGGGSAGGETRRRIRVFGGGTYFEWAASNRATNGATADGLWYDTTMRAAGHTLTFVAFDCGESFGVTSYGYTATADEFTYFAYANNAADAGILQTVVRYRRTCWR